MSRQRESKLSSKILTSLRAQGAFCFKVWGNEHMMAGLPDIMGCFKGHFFGFEVKRPETRENTSARQNYVAGMIRQAGGYVVVVCSSSEAVQHLFMLDESDA